MKRSFRFLCILMVISMLVCTFAMAEVAASTYEMEIFLIQHETIGGYFKAIRPDLEFEWTYLDEDFLGQVYRLKMKNDSSSHNVIVLFGESNQRVGYNKFFFHLANNTDEYFNRNLYDLILLYLMLMEPDMTFSEAYDALEEFEECIFAYEYLKDYDKGYTRFGSNGGSLEISINEETMAICVAARY